MVGGFVTILAHASLGGHPSLSCYSGGLVHIVVGAELVYLVVHVPVSSVFVVLFGVTF